MDLKIIILLLIVGAILVVGAFAGLQGLQQYMGTLMWMFLGLMCVMLVLFALWYMFFRKHPTDVNSLMEQHLRDSCAKGRMGVPKLTTNIQIAGDFLSSGCPLGRIKGYCRQSFTQNDGDWDAEDSGGIMRIVLDSKGAVCKVVEHCFEFQPDSALNNIPFLGAKTELLMVHDKAYKQADGSLKWDLGHSALIGSVKVVGGSIKRVGRYYYVDRDVNDIGLIDNLRTLEAHREMLHLLLGETHTIAMAGVNANPSHQIEKELQKKIGLVDRMMGGGQPKQLEGE